MGYIIQLAFVIVIFSSFQLYLGSKIGQIESGLKEFQESCSKFPCNESKNFTCEPVRQVCVCSEHSDERFMYKYDLKTEACIPLAKVDKDAFLICEKETQDVYSRFVMIMNNQQNLQEERQDFLGYCKSHFECSTKIPHSHCDFKSCTCQCGHLISIPDLRPTGAYQANGTCKLVKKHGEVCSVDQECPKLQICSDKKCQCASTYTFNETTLNCQRNETLCTADKDCLHQANSKCDHDMSKCTCDKGYMFSNKRNSCVLVKRLGETCSQDVECHLGIGENSNCVDSLCTCSPGFLSYQQDDTSTSTCVLKNLKLTNACKVDEQCVDEYSNCFDGQCQCINGTRNASGTGEPTTSSMVIFDKKNLKCVPVKAVGENCSTDFECGNDNAICRQGICQCANSNGSPLSSDGKCVVDDDGGTKDSLGPKPVMVGVHEIGAATGVFLMSMVVILSAIILKCSKRTGSTTTNTTSRTPQDSMPEGRLDSTAGFLNPATTSNTPYLPRPSNHEYLSMFGRCVEISKDHITIHRNKILGSGKGGMVYSGTFNHMNVAIKTLNPSSQRITMYLGSMCQEIEIYKSLVTDHPNIVKLLAFCKNSDSDHAGYDHNTTIASSTSIRGAASLKTVYMIMEFCPLGPLKKYLMQNKLLQLVTEDYESSMEGYSEKDFTEKDLMIWSFQIASGMEFLSMQNVIHADLATRNVLVCRKDLVKITDFGLGRKLKDEDAIYVKQRDELTPWKWSPPEVLEDNIFSTQSDIWSFGVTLWEIFSLGEEPFKEIRFTYSFSYELKHGTLRLERPALAPYHVYDLMKKCWNPTPKLRIPFQELRIQLNEIIQQPVQNTELEMEAMEGSQRKN